MYFCVNEFEVGVNESIIFGNEQQKMYFAIISFSCKHCIPKANGNTIAAINITNKILRGILVVVFSKCINGTGH